VKSSGVEAITTSVSALAAGSSLAEHAAPISSAAETASPGPRRGPYPRSMSVSFDLVTFDSPSPDDLAAFWTSALGMVETEREDGDRWIVLSTPDGVRRVGIQRGQTIVGTTHLDLACPPDEFDAELARLVDLGATIASTPRREPYGSIANLADPEGNPFDLCAYH
jgi:predicted enzyme related to lactoylglutathione lyase